MPRARLGNNPTLYVRIGILDCDLPMLFIRQVKTIVFRNVAFFLFARSAEKNTSRLSSRVPSASRSYANSRVPSARLSNRSRPTSSHLSSRDSRPSSKGEASGSLSRPQSQSLQTRPMRGGSRHQTDITFVETDDAIGKLVRRQALSFQCIG
jgi:hypothetical protein